MDFGFCLKQQLATLPTLWATFAALKLSLAVFCAEYFQSINQ